VIVKKLGGSPPRLAGRQFGITSALLLIGMVPGIACGAFGTYKQVRKYLKD
jgi:hypothetical protein